MTIYFSNVILLGISFVLIIANSVGTFKMMQAKRKLHFEAWVLFSGIIESICIVISIFYVTEMMLQINSFLQLTIVLITTKRFMRNYLKIKHVEHKLAG